jgi:hypothetical protein
MRLFLPKGATQIEAATFTATLVKHELSTNLNSAGSLSYEVIVFNGVPSEIRTRVPAVKDAP